MAPPIAIGESPPENSLLDSALTPAFRPATRDSAQFLTDHPLDPAAHALHALAVTHHDPVLIAYAVKRDAKARRAIWTRIGAAYPHEQGAGLTVVLDALPVDGRIILLERDAQDDARLEREAKRVRPQ